jgi:hypothetical protein
MRRAMFLAAMIEVHYFPLIKEAAKLLDASDWEYSVLGVSVRTLSYLV